MIESRTQQERSFSPRGRSGRPPASQRWRYQPGLEPLEDRSLPSAATIGPPTQFGSEAAFRHDLIERGVRLHSGMFGRELEYAYDRIYYGLGAPVLLAAASTSQSPSFSQTHTQVQGVDEGDSVKTDGRYLYVLSHGKLVILDAWPATNLKSLSETVIRGTPRVEYLNGDRLTVISEDYQRDETAGVLSKPSWISGGQPLVQVTVFDVSNRAAPTVVEQTALDGYYDNSRAIGNTVYVALHSFLNAPPPQYTATGHGYVYETEAAYRARVEAMPLDTILPSYTTYVGPADDTPHGPGLVTAAADIYRPTNPDDIALMSLVSFNVADAEAGPTDSLTLLTPSTGILYAGLDKFYLLSTPWAWGHEVTSIHQLSLQAGDIVLSATGQVQGRVLNQFSVGENGDYLYIATTSGWGPDASCNVYVLAATDPSLDIVGRIEGLAPRETIFSVRFVGDTGFVCTFERIDPLFAIDLSDPTHPLVAGQLEVTGFSRYLQAIDETHLIGIGREADPATGRILSIAISLYDVSDPNHPTLVSRYLVMASEWSHSLAESDFHAITYYPAFHILTIPVTQSMVSTAGGWREQTDLLVFHVDGASGTLELKGTVSDMSAIERGVFIGDVLYSVSKTSVQAHSLNDLDTLISHVPLPVPPNPDGTIPGSESPPVVDLPVQVIRVVPPENPPSSFGLAAAGDTFTFAISTTDLQVYMARVSADGRTTEGWGLVAPGQFLSIAVGTYGAGTSAGEAPIVFGVGTDHQIYGARFNANGTLSQGWVVVAPGLFDAVAVSMVDFSKPIVFGLGTQEAGQKQVFYATYSDSGALVSGWNLLAPGAFDFLVAGSASQGLGGEAHVFGVGTNHQVYGARFLPGSGARVGWYEVGPGDFSSLAVATSFSGKVALFGLGLDGRVYGAEPSAGLLKGWFPVADNAPVTFTQIAAAESADGTMSAFGLGRDGHVYQARLAGSNPSPWTRLSSELFRFLAASSDGGTAKLFALALADGEVEAVALDASGTPTSDFLATAPGSFFHVALPPRL